MSADDNQPRGPVGPTGPPAPGGSNTGATGPAALGQVPKLIEPQKYNKPTAYAPAEGGDLKNIRRCLKPRADLASMFATLVAAGTAAWTAVKTVPQSQKDQGVFPTWILVPIVLALGAAIVALLRFASARKDEHLKAAQADTDRLIAWHAAAQEALDRDMVAQLAERELANKRGLPSF